MSKKPWVGIGLLVLLSWVVLSWAAGARQVTEVINSATKALGCESLKTIEYSGSGYDFAIGQAPSPGAPWPKFNDKTYTRVINFETPASRMSRIRTQFENPPRGGGQQPIVGEQQQNQLIAPGTPQAAGLPDDLAMSLPYGFLRVAAASRDATVKTQSINGKKYTLITFSAGNKAPMTGYFNEQNILERVSTKIDNNVLGDMVNETVFTDYKNFSGLKFPTHIVQSQGGFPVLDLSITDVKPNAPADIENPQAKGKGTGATPAPPAITSEKLGDGMYLILGGYAAIAADFTDYIVIVEGPQNDQRAEQIITEAKRLIPNKPIRYVVNTHAHFDHAGGLRAFVAEGATVITYQTNKPYYEKVWANPHSITPDKLAQNPKKPKFETMGEKKVLTDGTHVIELYHMTNFLHNDGMIIAYLPKEKILLEADAFNPPAQPITQTPTIISPYNQALKANIDRLKLDVTRIIPVHYPADNRIITMTEFMKAIGNS
jgi:glyoxylase-like metal-dependent hydrolase (beta-lactamase superfamily II)